MGSVTQHHKTQNWDVRFKDKAFVALIGEPREIRFPPHAEEEARAAEKRIKEQINNGIIPPEFKGEKPTRGGDFTSSERIDPAKQVTLHKIIGAYEEARRVSESDKKLYSLMIVEMDNPRLCDMTLPWIE